MSTQSSDSTSAGKDSTPRNWEPSLLQELGREEVLFSRGFLRSKPELWFPNLSALWIPIAHSLGAQVSVKSVRTKMLIEAPNVYHCMGTVDDEPFGVTIDTECASALCSLLNVQPSDISGRLVQEYFIERSIWSLAKNWSVGEKVAVTVEAASEMGAFRPFSLIELEVLLNERVCTIRFYIGKLLTLKLDGLWRRQLMSQSRTLFPASKVPVELTYLAVPTVELPQYLRVGALIDLEIGLGHQALIYFAEEEQFQARLAKSGDKFVAITGARNFDRSSVPSDCTRVQVLLDKVTLTVDDKVELAQTGAAFFLDRELSGVCPLLIDGREVAEGVLQVYQEGLALRILRVV